MDSVIPPQNSPSPLQPYSEPEPQKDLEASSIIEEFDDVAPLAPYSSTPTFITEEPVETITEEPQVEEAPQISEEPIVVDEPTEKVSYADSSIQELDVSQIVANPYQPRTHFKQEALEELASSIREHGVIQPLVVTETPTGFQIVVGERRFRASQLAGLTKVPAIVKKSLHDQTKLE